MHRYSCIAHLEDAIEETMEWAVATQTVTVRKTYLSEHEKKCEFCKAQAKRVVAPLMKE